MSHINEQRPIQTNEWTSVMWSWQRPTLPPYGSTIGAMELNFSVRNGKRWSLHAITTNKSFGLATSFFIDYCQESEESRRTFPIYSE
jgi:hypothetical protein